MKLLFITQYFPPEVGAPQNRIYELAIRLLEKGVDITVLTAMPNYPQMEIHKEYQNKKYVFETMNDLKVHRSSIKVSKSKSIFTRLLGYFSFVISSYMVGIKKLDKKYDIVICESPPLFLGISAYFISKRKKAKFIFNISDLWPESAEKLGLVRNKLFLKLASYLEEYLYKKAHLISGQTLGICNNISNRFPKKKIIWLPNGVDLSYYNPDNKTSSNWREKNNFKDTDILYFYGGIIGYAQGLEIIINVANKLKTNSKIKFIILGNGPEKEKLISLNNKLGLDNVFFFDVVTKDKMPNILLSVDYSIVPLKKLDLFLGAIPSKIFECLAMKVPIILGVDGEARELFINKGNCGLYFEPENVEQLYIQIMKTIKDTELKTKLGNNARDYVLNNFNRENIAANFKKELDKLFQKK